jgi:ribosomal protein L14
MIMRQTKIRLMDNSGCKQIRCIGYKRSIRCRFVGLNDTVCVSLRIFSRKKFFESKLKKKRTIHARLASKMIKKKERRHAKVQFGIIIGCSKKFYRRDGTYLRKKKNKVVLLDEKRQCRGSKIKGYILKETRKKKRIPVFKQIAALGRKRL